MEFKEKRSRDSENETDVEFLNMNAAEEPEYDEETEHHRKLSMFFHFLMVVAAIIIVVVVVSVLMLRNNPITYNDIDASDIEVSGVYENIVEWEQDTNIKSDAEHYVENKVSITVLTQDSEVPPVLLEGVLSELHGMNICFSQDSKKGYYAACFTSGDTTYLLESAEITKKQFTDAVEQFVEDQY